jgi:hypothetical protein
MARTRAAHNPAAEAETVTGYFRRILGDNPRLLRTRSNDELVRRWQDDHPGQPVTDQIKTGITNAKSSLRHKRRKRRARKEAPQPAAATHVLPKPANPPRRLEVLEEQIDDCLDLAKGLDRDGLASVIKLLHRARNEVVWKIGQ